jgi:hypothetical protein
MSGAFQACAAEEERLRAKVVEMMGVDYARVAMAKWRDDMTRVSRREQEDYRSNVCGAGPNYRADLCKLVPRRR